MYSVLSSYLNIPTKYSLLAIYKCSFKTVWPSVQTCSKTVLLSVHVPKTSYQTTMFLRNSLDICICSYSLAICTVYLLLLPGHLYMFLPKSLAICTCSYSLAIFTCSYVQKSLFICRCSYKSPWSSVHVPTKVPGHLFNVHVPTVIPGHLYMFLLSSLAICTCSY